MKYFKWFLILVGTASLGWYIFIKDHHHRIAFSSNQPVGVYYRHILSWEEFKGSGIDSIQLVESVPFNQITQRVYVKDSLFNYRWELEPTGDLSTKVSVYVTDERNEFQQKWEVPFKKNDFVSANIRNIETVGMRMIENSRNFRLSEITDTLIPSTHCAYLELETRADTKASNMIRNIGIIMNYINENELELRGEPFLMVNDWNLDNDHIKYHFCFPIERTDSIPSDPRIKFKQTSSTNALKVIFNGNYRISYQAWYYLRAYAEEKGLDVTGLPTEIFYNDPHSGGNDLLWRADVLMPYN